MTDGDIIASRMENWDHLLTVISSTRDLRIISFFSSIYDLSFVNFLFGIGFHDVLNNFHIKHYV